MGALGMRVECGAHPIGQPTQPLQAVYSHVLQVSRSSEDPRGVSGSCSS